MIVLNMCASVILFIDLFICWRSLELLFMENMPYPWVIFYLYSLVIFHLLSGLPSISRRKDFVVGKLGYWISIDFLPQILSFSSLSLLPHLRPYNLVLFIMCNVFIISWAQWNLGTAFFFSLLSSTKQDRGCWCWFWDSSTWDWKISMCVHWKSNETFGT